MKKFSKLIVIALSCMMVLSMASCGSALKDPSVAGIKKYGSLVVCTSPDFPPFEYKEGNKCVGWDIDVAAKFAEDLGVELKIVEADFDSVLLAPNADKAHIGMAGISYSEERAKTVTFTESVFESKQVLIVKNDSTIATLADLKDKKVGGQRGTVGYNIANCDPTWAFDGDNLIIGKPAKAISYQDGATAVLDLINGRNDAVIIDILPAKEYVKANAGRVKILMDGDNELVVKEDNYAFLLKKGNDDLKDKLNELIAKYKTDGTFKAINEKYLAND